ncbi:MULTISPECIES: alpha/beta hydrolase fold domain-containing protein [unclassified Kribbella]|uniref:alpha/beta hydrolase n=1 Tax=unclassified Kribbella TaxID=2644121 RepID=UPI0033FC5CE7
MTTVRSAAVQLRGSSGPIWARVYWPPASGTSPPLLVFLPGAGDPDPECRQLCRRGGLVILAGPTSPQYDEAVADAKAIVGWAADHAVELQADPARLLITGTGDGARVAAAVTRLAADEGWPDLVLMPDLITTLEGTNR